MKLKIDLTPGAYLLAAFMLLLLPLRWMLAALLAGAFHEACHYLAIRLCGGKVLGMKVDLSGAVLRISPMPPLQELICALAGPAGGLLLLLGARHFPHLAICAAFQSIYNLLPLYPLDGGRALRRAAESLFPPKTALCLCTMVRQGCLGLMLLLGIYGTFFLRLGWLPLLAAALHFLKYTCKPDQQSLQ